MTPRRIKRPSRLETEFDGDPFIRPPEPRDNSGDEYAPFITGSHAYGITRPTSDIDLVLLVTPELRKFLELFNEEHSADLPNSAKRALRIGRLNLICVTSQHEWEMWQQGTLECIDLFKSSGKPVDKTRAKEIFDRLRTEYGIS